LEAGEPACEVLRVVVTETDDLRVLSFACIIDRSVAVGIDEQMVATSREVEIRPRFA